MKSPVATGEQSKVWVFQAVPERYDILVEVSKRLSTSERGDNWSVTRHEAEMQVGQRVLLWRSGPDGGIHGTGTLSSLPYGPWNDRRVDIKFDPLLEHPLRKDALRKHPVLKNLSVLRMARGTNFPVTPTQWTAVQPFLVVRQSEGEREAAVEQNKIPKFKPKGVRDARKRILRSIVQRQGQPKFRQQLLGIYGSQCLISGCNAVAALEAAHICPYKGNRTNNPTNGILLRSDLHTLFDLYLITIHPERMRVTLAPQLWETNYREFENKKLKFPANGPAALQQHWDEFRWRVAHPDSLRHEHTIKSHLGI